MRDIYPEELERARVTNPDNPLMATRRGDKNGLFCLRLGPLLTAVIIASDGRLDDENQAVDWEHVSVHVRKYTKTAGGKRKLVGPRTPTWEEMCRIKDLFWDEEECVVQFHPPRSEYVNIHEHCLHLWRRVSSPVETPPNFCI